ncbi:hypothetical protein GF348_24190 [candidate division KSB3 bacterium]|nr:hypothetical protein [candidate division KSB3 bacterium]
MNKETMRWLMLFITLTAFFYWVDQAQWFNALVLDGLAHINAVATVWVLSFMGMQLEHTGTMIITGSGYIEIAKSCTGSFVFFMFVAAVLPFPSPWGSRLKGLFYGLLALLILNLFRTCMIVLVGVRFPDTMETFHIIIGQIVVIAGMTTVFLWWVKSLQLGTRLNFFNKNRTIIRAVSLFCAGYLGGFWLYQAFLESPFGTFMQKMIEIHALWLISFLNRIIFGGQASPFAFYPVQLIEGCLSSPMVVLFVAVVLAWPMHWWKRAIIILLGFIPLFYGYHVLRAVLIAMTLGIQSKEVNFVYNFYGQMLLTIAFFAYVAYFWCSKIQSVSYRRFFLMFLPSALIAFGVALGLDGVMHHFLIPYVTVRITGSTHLSYDPEQSLSLMLPVMGFIWISLVGATPHLTWLRKGGIGILGIVFALLVTVGLMVIIEVFHLVPHKGLFKLSVLLLPFAVYFFLFLHTNHQAHVGKNGDAPPQK